MTRSDIPVAVALGALLCFTGLALLGTFADPEPDLQGAAIHVLCRGQERYIDCKERWADAYAHDLGAPDEATAIGWWNQGAECRLQGFDLYDEATGRCTALGEEWE